MLALTGTSAYEIFVCVQVMAMGGVSAMGAVGVGSFGDQGVVHWVLGELWDGDWSCHFLRNFFAHSFFEGIFSTPPALLAAKAVTTYITIPQLPHLYLDNLLILKNGPRPHWKVFNTL